MKFLIAVLTIHFVAALIERKFVDKIEPEKKKDEAIKHPAEHLVR
jgi:hypothetical protein